MPALILSLALTSSADERAMGMLRQWIIAVDAHAAGERDAALAKIAAWTVDDLDMMRAYLSALAEVPVDTPERNLGRRQISGADDL